jgi:hypothetical protein
MELLRCECVLECFLGWVPLSEVAITKFFNYEILDLYRGFFLVVIQGFVYRVVC